MSLHSLAHHLQEAGRGEDSVLVHMTPREVGGLQSLALAHGGSLTINPQTGLPEAGFLSSILPMVAGLALGPAGLELTAMQAGLATGALGAAMTGSLGKGLMAGLGAYGGAGLGAGLANTGATELANAAYAPQGAQWANVAQNIQNFNPAAAAAETTAAGTAAAETATGGLPELPNLTAPSPYASAVSNTVPVGAPVPAQGAMNMANAEFGVPQASTPSTSLMDAIREAQANLPAQGSFELAAPPTVSQGIAPADVASGLPPAPSAMGKLTAGVKNLNSWDNIKGLYNAVDAAAPYAGTAGLGSMAMGSFYDKKEAQERAAAEAARANQGLIRPYDFSYNATGVESQPYTGSAERTYFNPVFTARKPYKAPGPEYAAEGGLMGLAVGGPVEQMAAMNAVGANAGYPQAQIQAPMYSNPMVQRPMQSNVIASGLDAPTEAYSGESRFAGGGLSSLGGYSDGGRLLKGPGDGVSDSIPAVIGDRQPARLADGEFVVPARIVSELGNGSTEAGAKRLYAMMDRVQKARRKTVGKDRVAANTNAERYLPA